MALSDRVAQALIHYDNKKYDSCLLELCTAVELTAKKKWPQDNQVGSRFKAFFHEYRHFIIFGAFGWRMVPFDDLKISEADATLAKLLYNRMRTAVVHDGTIDDGLFLVDEGIVIADRFGIGREFILALIIAVVGDPVNSGEQFSVPVRSLQIGAVPIPLVDAWGQFPALDQWLKAQAKSRKNS
ncbi:MAG: hypothetical protein M3Y65_12945 [Pseudomonadota bacterium]|nr:hypothetical protein [Pseudomonadota bacterium]